MLLPNDCGCCRPKVGSDGAVLPNRFVDDEDALFLLLLLLNAAKVSGLTGSVFSTTDGAAAAVEAAPKKLDTDDEVVGADVMPKVVLDDEDTPNLNRLSPVAAGLMSTKDCCCCCGCVVLADANGLELAPPKRSWPLWEVVALLTSTPKPVVVVAFVDDDGTAAVAGAVALPPPPPPNAFVDVKLNADDEEEEEDDCSGALVCCPNENVVVCCALDDDCCCCCCCCWLLVPNEKPLLLLLVAFDVSADGVAAAAGIPNEDVLNLMRDADSACCCCCGLRPKLMPLLLLALEGRPKLMVGLMAAVAAMKLVNLICGCAAA